MILRNLRSGFMARVGAALLLTALSAAAGPLGYTINFSGQFGTVDLVTGTFATIGPGIPNTPDGIGGRPGGPFFTVDSVTGHLLRIDTNGAVTDVGDTGTGGNVGPNGISVMGSLTTGALYGIDFSNKLYSLNSSNGSATLLGTVTGLPTQESQYDGNMTTSFNGNASTIYYTLEISGGPNATGPTLFAINPGTLGFTSVGLTGLSGRIIGSGFVGGQLYAFDEFGGISAINTLTGVASAFGSYVSGSDPMNPGPPFTGIFGVVATPEPATILMSAGGLALCVALRRRKPKAN